MSDKLRVRLYNIRFGDAVLVTVPDNGTTRHILIDVGNVLVGEGGLDAVFKPVIEDIKAELGGKPLDLYVMTHEHMDHIQGLPFAKEKANLELDVAFAWLTASAAEDYYDEDKHPDARKKNLEALAMFDQIETYLEAAPDPALKGLLLNNNPRSTGDCVAYLRGLAGADKTAYVHREADIEGTHPFEEAKLAIWGPEEDTADYYRSLQPLALARRGRRRRERSQAARSSTRSRPRASTRARSTTSSTAAARACTTTCSRSTRRRTTRASSSRSSGAAGSSCSRATPSRRAGG